MLQDHILKDILPRGFDARMEENQKKHQQAIEKKDPTISLFNDDLKNREYENVGLQGEIRAKDQVDSWLASSQRTMMKQGIHIYLYADSMVREGTRTG